MPLTITHVHLLVKNLRSVVEIWTQISISGDISLKILVADDNASVRRILSALLAAWGYTVVTAADGREAWDILQQDDSPHFAILDWMMPEIDGIDICRNLRSLPTTFPHYVILLTCRGQKEDIVTGLEAGADDYVTKPFEAEELRARVEVGKRYLELQNSLKERMSELQKQGSELRKSNRALMLLNKSSHLLATAGSEIELLQNICKEMVENAGYKLAWIGITKETHDFRLLPTAQAGFENGALEAMRLAWSDIDPSRSPAGRAIQSGHPAIIRDIPNNRQYAHRMVEAAVRGFSSLISVPFKATSTMKGALNIYAKEPDAFDGEEVRLLIKLAENLSYGINAIRTANERRQFEEALQKERDQAQLYLDIAGVLMVALDSNGDIMLVNSKGCSILGISQPELVGKNWFSDFLPLDTQLALLNDYKDLMYTGNGFLEYFESKIVTRDGVEKVLAVHASLLRNIDRKITGMLFSGEDITERKRAEKALRTSEENYRTLFDRMVSTTSAITAYRSGSEDRGL
jgi:PAS domain S-box-containing protein